MEKTYSVHKTAQILGFCLDTVRRSLRSGQLPGIRVGRRWRVAESTLAAQLGLPTLDAMTAPATPNLPGEPTSPEALAPEPRLIESRDEVVAPLLRTAPVRARILELTLQAAENLELRPKKAHYLLEDLDTLLHHI